MHRLNIYSNRKQNHLKQSVSTGNINCVGSDDFVTKLGSKLSLLKTQEEAFEIVEEKQEEKDSMKDSEDKEGKNTRYVHIQAQLVFHIYNFSKLNPFNSFFHWTKFNFELGE